MEINYNLISFIDTLGVVQGLLLGFMLIFSHSKQNRAVIFLGLFIILFSLEPINNILHELKILERFPKLELLPVSFHFLAYPLFYIYIQRISILKYRKSSSWSLIPGIIELIAGLIVFFLPIATKLQIKESNIPFIYFLLGLAYTLYILYLTTKWLHLHRKEIENQYSSLWDKKLKWAHYFIYASIVFYLFLIAVYITGSKQLYMTASLINIVLIYWISYQGFVQKNVSPVYVEIEKNETEHTIAKNDKNATEQEQEQEQEAIDNSKNKNHEFLSPEEAEDILNTIKDYITQSKCFIKDDLTIVDVSEAVNIHPKRISYTINNQLTINFNNYINGFRVAYAKELFNSEAAKNLSIEGIGIEAGFRSKTTFYSAFHKIEGTTPAKYRGL